MFAQDSRMAEIEKARSEKAARLKPDEVSKTENLLSRFKDEKLLERFSQGFNGIRAKIGNMVTGGGFAIGPEYSREDLFKGYLQFRTAAQVSTRGYYKIDNQWTLPRLAKNKLALDIYTVHHNYASINYYGPGANSTKGGRSNYRLEDTSAEATSVFTPVRGLAIGGTVGGLWMNIGPGNDRRFISADRIFTEAQAPGIQRQTNFFRYGVFLQHDTRDNPITAKAGRNVIFQYTWFDDIKLNTHNFRRIDAEVQQFIPILNRSRVFALRAKTVLTEANGNETAPFYLQPILGGSDDLRGFRNFRFSDRDMVVFNAEYRWEIFAGLDGALFMDAGKVFSRRGQLNFSNLERSYGFGLRGNARNATFLRVDVGFSREGFQVWVKFNDVFRQRRFGADITQPVF
ncbi:MAG: BamA/TamA family outer membrane protein [Bryobacteraceae bacterium]|nr:BamA/TamA family outer membrane protein [Bryobacteraceae bacterium]